jgi:hypothetical protein
LHFKNLAGYIFGRLGVGPVGGGGQGQEETGMYFLATKALLYIFCTVVFALFSYVASFLDGQI